VAAKDWDLQEELEKALAPDTKPRRRQQNQKGRSCRQSSRNRFVWEWCFHYACFLRRFRRSPRCRPGFT